MAHHRLVLLPRVPHQHRGFRLLHHGESEPGAAGRGAWAAGRPAGGPARSPRLPCSRPRAPWRCLPPNPRTTSSPSWALGTRLLGLLVELSPDQASPRPAFHFLPHPGCTPLQPGESSAAGLAASLRHSWALVGLCPTAWLSPQVAHLGRRPHAAAVPCAPAPPPACGTRSPRGDAFSLCCAQDAASAALGGFASDSRRPLLDPGPHASARPAWGNSSSCFFLRQRPSAALPAPRGLSLQRPRSLRGPLGSALSF